MAIKFYRYKVVNTETGDSVKISFYSLDNHVSGKPCVTLYAREYGYELHKLLRDYAEVKNATDIMTDYFEHSHVTFYEGDRLYATARARAELNEFKDDERRNKRLGIPTTKPEPKPMTTQSRPRQLTAKFAGKCNDCGRHVDAGEQILWISRGVIECSDCMDKPELGAARALPVSAPKPLEGAAWDQAFSWDESATQPPAEAPPAPKAPKVVSINRIVPANSEPAEDIPALDAQAQTVCDLLVTLINAAARLNADQCRAVRKHATDLAEHSDNETRRHLWAQAAQALS